MISIVPECDVDEACIFVEFGQMKDYNCNVCIKFDFNQNHFRTTNTVYGRYRCTSSYRLGLGQDDLATQKLLQCLICLGAEAVRPMLRLVLLIKLFRYLSW